MCRACIAEYLTIIISVVFLTRSTITPKRSMLKAKPMTEKKMTTSCDVGGKGCPLDCRCSWVRSGA